MFCQLSEGETHHGASVQRIKEDEDGPVARVAEAFGSQFLLRTEQGFAFAETGHEVAVETDHEVGRGVVVDVLEAHQQGVDTGVLEASLQAEDAVASQLSQSCLAGREHGQVALSQVHLCYLCRRDEVEAVDVGSGKGQQAVVHGLGVGAVLVGSVDAVGGNVQEVDPGAAECREGGSAGFGVAERFCVGDFGRLQDGQDGVHLSAGVAQVGKVVLAGRASQSCEVVFVCR